MHTFDSKSRSLNLRASTLAIATSLAACSLAAAPGTAHAQTQTTAAPIRQFTDANGVDLMTGTFTTTTGVAVGNAENGLAFTREIRGAYALDNMLGEIIAGSSTTITLDAVTERFTLSGGVFTPVEQNGSTLSLSGSTYTYRRADGTTALFAAPPANYYQFGNARGIVPTSITYPNGKVLTFNYTVGSFTPPGAPNVVYGRRLASVGSNTGYGVTFTYEASVPTQTNNHLWTHITNVSTGSGPSLTISPITGETPGVRDYTDSMNRTTRYTFGGYGSSVSGIRLPGSTANDITVTYTGDKVSAVTAFGVTSTYSYSDAGNIRTTTVTRGSEPSRVFKFDLTKLVMTSQENELDQVTEYQYDASNRLTRVTMPEDNYVEYAYDSRGNVTSTTAVPKPSIGGTPIVTTAGYDASCTVAVKCNQPNWTKTSRGNPSDPNDLTFRTDYTYDLTHGGVLTVTAPAPTTNAARPQVRYTYAQVNASGVEGSSGVFKVKTVSACRTLANCAGTADERRTTYAFGQNQNVASVTTSAGDGSLAATTAFAYDGAGNLVSVDGPETGEADKSVAFYDAIRRPTGAIAADPDGTGAALFPAVKYTYRADGQLDFIQSGTATAQSAAALNSISELSRQTITYDSHHRPVRQVLTGGGTTFGVSEQRYDAVGRVECTIVRMNSATWGTPLSSCTPPAVTPPVESDRVTYLTYDALGRVAKVTAAYGTAAAADEASSTFTANGRLQTLTDAEGNRTTYEYDGHDRLAKTRFPSPTTDGVSSTTDFEQLGYDANGNVTSFRTRRNETLTMTYDNLDRLVTKVIPDRAGLDATHERDVFFGYDLHGNMTYARFDSASGEGIVNAFDALGRLESTTNTMDGASRTLAYQYDVSGDRTRLTWPDGNYLQYFRHPSGAFHTAYLNAASPLVSLIRDAAGRESALYRLDTSTGTWANPTLLSYDAVSRLSEFTLSPAGTTYDVAATLTYNPAGQIAGRTGNNDAYAWAGSVNGTAAYAANGLNQYTAITGTPALSYDANGNLAQATSATWPAENLTYDAENRLVGRASGTFTASARYDPLGRLYEVTSNAGWSVPRRLAYDGDALVAEYHATTGALLRRFVHGTGAGDDPLVWFEGATVADSARRYLYADERGSIVAVTDGAGGVTATAKYDEYGKPSSTASPRFMYTGQAYHAELASYYYKARLYNPYLGRFLQTDPIGYGDGMNLYAYVGNDPVNAVDPTGLDLCPVQDGPGAVEWEECIKVEADRCRGVWIGLVCVDFSDFDLREFINPLAFTLPPLQGPTVGGAPLGPQSEPGLACSIIGLLGDSGRLRLGADGALGDPTVTGLAVGGLGVALRGDGSFEFDAYLGAGYGLGYYGSAGVSVDNAGGQTRGGNANISFAQMAAFGIPAPYVGGVGAYGEQNTVLYPGPVEQGYTGGAGVGVGPKIGILLGSVLRLNGSYRTGGICN